MLEKLIELRIIDIHSISTKNKKHNIVKIKCYLVFSTFPYCDKKLY
jgi:hypothetical protein